MPLHRRVGEIFLPTASDTDRATFSNSLRRFLVRDAGTGRTGVAVVLLLESPHTHEVGYRYPLAGDTGRYVSKILLDDIPVQQDDPCVPIGRYVHDGCIPMSTGDDVELKLGVMNVSCLPLQREAYDCVPWSSLDCRRSGEWSSYIRHINTVRNGPCARTRNDPDCRNLENAIVNDLKGRLNRLRRRNNRLLLVLCGNVAFGLYRKTRIAAMSTCYLPHPSTNGWEKASLQERLHCIKERLCTS